MDVMTGASAPANHRVGSRFESQGFLM